jgi:hypothetical protein
MKNEIRHVTRQQYAEIVKAVANTSTFIGELDGRDIHDLGDFLEKVYDVFQFPNYYKSIDGYLDWIRDLDWLQSDGFIFAILNFKSFMDADPHAREIILASMEDTVIPWWDGDVEKYSVGGKAKPFNVYYVD